MIDIFEIIEMSRDAEVLLLNNNMGKIHSIYKNTINISLEERIVSIHPNNVIKSPMSLRMEREDIDLESLDLNTGDIVKINRDSFNIEKYKFVFKDSKKWNPSLTETHIDFKNKYDKEYEIIKDLLKTSGGENAFKNIIVSLIEDKPIDIKEKDYFSAKVYSSLKELIVTIRMRDADKSVDKLFDLLGLGIGLTPSGDDFIMGLMSVLTVSKDTHPFCEKFLLAIKTKLKDSLDRTTFLSSELYFYILEDKYSSIFIDIFEAVEMENTEALSGTILTLLDMGHSSGGDTLCGIVFGIHMIKHINPAFQ